MRFSNALNSSHVVVYPFEGRSWRALTPAIPELCAVIHHPGHSSKAIVTLKFEDRGVTRGECDPPVLHVRGIATPKIPTGWFDQPTGFVGLLLPDANNGTLRLDEA